MKNLKKLSHKELKSINGGAQGCYYTLEGLICPCKPGYKKCPNGSCIPNNQLC